MFFFNFSRTYFIFQLITSQLLSHQSRVEVGDPQYPLGSFKGAIQKNCPWTAPKPVLLLFCTPFAQLLLHIPIPSTIPNFSSLLCFQLRSLHTTPSKLYLLVRRDYCSSSRVASFLVLVAAAFVAGADGRVVLVLFQWCWQQWKRKLLLYYYGLDYFECWFAHSRMYYH